MTIDVRDYDLATLYRFKLFFDSCYWINRPNCNITEIRNGLIYENKRVEFPLITLRRVSTPIMYKDAQNSWAVGRTGDRRGRDITISPDGRTSTVDMTMVQTNYELRYMLEVFSLERDNFDELVVEVQENLFRYPYLTFENWKDKDLRMPDPQVAGMSTNITWESTEDNTDLESFDSQTPFYRATITFTLRAYIYRKYAALLLEDVINGYRVLDHNHITQQVVKSNVDLGDSDGSISPSPTPDPPTPIPYPPTPTPTGNVLTLETVASLDSVGSMGMFLYNEVGELKSYGSEINGLYLKPVSINTPFSGQLSYTLYSDISLTGTWKLLCVARERTELNPCLVFAVKIDEKTPTKSGKSLGTRNLLGNFSNQPVNNKGVDLKYGWFNLQHKDQELVCNILLSDDNQYIPYEEDKEYIIVNLVNEELGAVQTSFDKLKLVNHQGKLALDTNSEFVSASCVWYRVVKKNIDATDFLYL